MAKKKGGGQRHHRKRGGGGGQARRRAADPEGLSQLDEHKHSAKQISTVVGLALGLDAAKSMSPADVVRAGKSTLAVSSTVTDSPVRPKGGGGVKKQLMELVAAMRTSAEGDARALLEPRGEGGLTGAVIAAFTEAGFESTDWVDELKDMVATGQIVRACHVTRLPAHPLRRPS
jgi:hypothetical protein